MPLAQSTTLDLRVGDIVEIRSQAEILATLDENGELDSMPFMPEMLQYCGQRLTVYKVAHKTCDTLTRSGMRRMENAVHLSGVRCDGSGHGGCQAACMIYWKHAWLRKVDSTQQPAAGAPRAGESDRLLPLLTISARRPPAEDGTEMYRCQITEMPRAAPTPMPLKDVSQYVQDVRSGNVGVFWTIRTIYVGLYNRVQGLSGRVLPPRLQFRGGRRWGILRGTADKTPSVQTNLQPGDLVRIRSKEEVAATLNADLLNRGMGFDAEMARFCGQTATVARRVDRIIDEHTGRMIKMRNPCIVLDNVICEGAFNLSCPRAITPYWREAWLEKIDQHEPRPAGEQAKAGAPTASAPE
jgi:hypothetical protein